MNDPRDIETIYTLQGDTLLSLADHDDYRWGLFKWNPATEQMEEHFVQSGFTCRVGSVVMFYTLDGEDDVAP